VKKSAIVMNVNSEVRGCRDLVVQTLAVNESQR